MSFFISLSVLGSGALPPLQENEKWDPDDDYDGDDDDHDDDVFLGVVAILEPLDYERAHSYLLTVQATDGGEPPLTNHATVNVTVTDVNDNEPIFLQNSYSVIVNEAAIIGDVLIQVGFSLTILNANMYVLYLPVGDDDTTFSEYYYNHN